MKQGIIITILAFTGVLGLAAFDHHEGGTVQYTEEGNLLRPDPTGWPFVSVSVSAGEGGMMMVAEGEGGRPEGANYHLIQVNPKAFDQYMDNSTFPEGTVFTMSFYNLDNMGQGDGTRFWAREVQAMEVSVKDSERFADGWAYFRFTGDETEAEAFPGETCFACHAASAETDKVFTQFYAAFQ